MPRPDSPQRLPSRDYLALEWNAWQELLDVLYDARVLRLSDLDRPEGYIGTRGCRVLAAIKTWAEANGDLRVHRDD